MKDGETRTHYLKTWPAEFDAVRRGDKMFDVRRDDRGFMVGDVLVLREYDPAIEHTVDRFRYTDEEIVVCVTYVLHGGRFGVDPGFCVLGIKKVKGKS